MSFSKKKSSGTVAGDYAVYRMNLQEKLMTVLTVLLVSGSLSWAFYDSLLPAAVLVLPAGLLYGKKRRKTLLARRRENLKRQFLYAAGLLGDYLKSGYSIENALLRSQTELREVWGEKSDILREWQRMASLLSISKTAEEVFSDFGRRSAVEQIRDFTDIFAIVKRSGGQLGEILSVSCAALSEQFATEEQIRTAIVSQRLEQKIMDIVPLAILFYIRLASPDLLAVMYTTLSGRAVMTVCLLLYLAAYFWSELIMNIEF